MVRMEVLNVLNFGNVSKRMSPHRLPRTAYRVLLHLHEQNKKTWASSVCYVLCKYEFSEVWVIQGVGNKKTFLKEFKERVLSSYRQDWENNLRTKERYSVYSTFQLSLSLSTYLIELKHVKARNFLIRSRLGVSPLRIHTLRNCKAVTLVDYFCPFCVGEVESEVHFIFVSKICRDEGTVHIEKKNSIALSVSN